MEKTLSEELSRSGWPASVWETVLIVNGYRVATFSRGRGAKRYEEL